MLAMTRMANEKMHVQAFEGLFKAMDADQSGFVTFAEFDAYLQDPTCRLYLDSLGIVDPDSRILFNMLDDEGQGCITLTDFVEACANLKGSAKAIHFAKLERRSRA